MFSNVVVYQFYHYHIYFIITIITITITILFSLRDHLYKNRSDQQYITELLGVQELELEKP